MVPESVKSVAKQVSEHLKSKGIKHAIIGGIAVSAFSPPRTTEDVDFLIPESDSGVVYEFGDPAPVSGIYLQGLTVEVEGHNVDFMFLPDDLSENVLLSGNIIDGIPIIPQEVLIFLKLKVGRVKDIGDVVAMLKTGGDRDKFKKFLKKYSPDMLEDFESIIMMADFESEKFKDKGSLKSKKLAMDFFMRKIDKS
jgi:hypothetical protein